MNRRTLASLFLGAVVVSSVGGWAAGSRIRSPAEVAARTAAPTASPILVPAELRTLSTDIVTRGTARFGSPRQVSMATSALKTDPSVVTQIPVLGTELAEGDIAFTASGRPVFLLTGAVPTYRDLGPGLEGDDVHQLEDALQRLGFDPGPIDGVYDELTEAAVKAWYESAGFTAFEATADQLGAIRSLEADLAAARLDVLGASDAVAAAEADLVAATNTHDLAVALAGGGDGAVIAARAEAAAGDATASLDVTNKQAALEALRSGTPAPPAEIASAEADLGIARGAAELVRLEGSATVQAAQDALDDAPATLAEAEAAAAAANDVAALEVAVKQNVLDAAPAALAEAESGAAAANDVAALEVAVKQNTLDALLLDSATPPVELTAARTELALAAAAAQAVRLDGNAAVSAARRDLDVASTELASATAAARAVRLDGLAAVSAAQRDLSRSSRELADAQVRADAANQAASLEVYSKQGTLNALRAITPGAAQDITAAERELAVARAAAEATRLAGVEMITAAQAGKQTDGGDVAVTAAAEKAAEQVLTNAQAASDARSTPTNVVELQLGTAQRQAGVQMPADEMIFVANTPIRVSETSVAPGDQAIGPVMTVTDSVVAIDSSLPLEEAPLVTDGMTVVIDEPDLGISAMGTITRIADSPGTDGVDGFHIYVEVTVDGAPARLVGSSVRLTISIESTGGQVLAVPVSALNLAADGSSRVQRQASNGLEYVGVEPGLSADGFVGVTPISGALEPGDQVVVGFNQAAPAGG